MNEPRITEADVADVMLGHSDPLLEAKVRQAIADDLRLARAGQKWRPVGERLREDTRATRAMADRIGERVMKRLPEVREEDVLPFLEMENMERGFRFPTLRGLLDPFQSRQSLGVGSVLAVMTMLVLMFISVVAMVSYQMGAQNSAGLARLAQSDNPEKTLASPRSDDTSPVPESGKTLLTTRDNVWSASFLTGEATLRSGTLENKVIPVAVDEPVRFPARIDLGRNAVARLALPHESELNLTGPCSLEQSPREVSLLSGAASFRIGNRKDGLVLFRVNTEQGQVIDLGTEFSVAMNNPESCRIAVTSGRVRVSPRRGLSVELPAGTEGLLLDNRVITAPAFFCDTEALEDDSSGSGSETAHFPFAPQTRIMEMNSPLMSQIRPQSVCLLDRKPRIVKKAPPFTSDRPLMTVIRLMLDGQLFETAVAVDRKLNNRLRVYVDRNNNGDLTDDPVFSEEEDFIDGEYFAVGLGRFDEALWIRQTVTPSGSFDASDAQEKLEYINRLYLMSDRIPLKGDNPGLGPFRFAVVDSDSDGEYWDEDGAMGFWLRAGGQASEIEILGVARGARFQSDFMGMKWKMESRAHQLMLLGSRQ